MPAKRPARTCRKPSCLCNRPLGADLLNTHCFSVVACSHNCRRPVFYFHEQCAEFYVQSLKTCGWCKAKLVSLRSPSTTNLMGVGPSAPLVKCIAHNCSSAPCFFLEHPCSMTIWGHTCSVSLGGHVRVNSFPTQLMRDTGL